VNAYKLGTVLLTMSTFAQPALADNIYYDNAQVVSVTPQTERVNNPHQECHTEYVSEATSGERDVGGAIIGGIAGGLLGSQIGKGNGRVAAAVVGAATGAIVGDRIDNSGEQTTASKPVERCVLVDNWQTVSRGYLVSYRLNGHDYTTNLSYGPGNTLRVRVAVTPDDNSRVSYQESPPVRERDFRGSPPRHDRRWD
jgi:uncharacterized protein YcfJ